MRGVTTKTVASLVVMAAMSASGCATRTDLTPVAAAPSPGAESVVSSIQGVRYTLETDAWIGRDDVLSYVTPVRVRIRNASDRRIRIDYNQFALISPEGERYAALPPYGVEGAVSEPVLTAGYSPVAHPAFHYDGFFVAPYYAPVYPGILPYPSVDPYYYDPVYFSTYSKYWAQIPLPTEPMLNRALPPGVLDPGGEVDGYLYFERTGIGVDRVRFRADVVAAEDGRRIGEIRIPLTAEREPLT